MLIYRSCIFNAFNPEMINRLKSKGYTGYTLYIKVYKLQDIFLPHHLGPQHTTHTSEISFWLYSLHSSLCGAGSQRIAWFGLVYYCREVVIIIYISLLILFPPPHSSALSSLILSSYSCSLLIDAEIRREWGLSKLQMLGSGDSNSSDSNNNFMASNTLPFRNLETECNALAIRKWLREKLFNV